MSWDKKNIIEQRPCLSKQEVKAYLDNSLDNSERFSVENHMLDCALCQSAMEGYIQFPTEISENISAPKRRNWFYLAAAALLILLGVSAFFSYSFNNKSASIFANYYDRPSWDVQTRGEAEEGQYAKAIQLYNQKHYAAALEKFDTLLSIQPEDNRLRLYKGIAHLESSQYNVAETEFKTVRINSDLFFEEASWYLALLQIKLDNNEEAINYLNELIDLKEGFFYERAIEIKKGLQD